MGPEDSLLDAGLGFTCAWDKTGGFVGREALLEQRELEQEQTSGRRRLVSFMLDDPEPLLFHNEPIFRDEKLASYTTSAGYGHTLGGAMAMGYLDEDRIDAAALSAARFEIEVDGKRQSARASLTPLYDPKHRRIRS